MSLLTNKMLLAMVSAIFVSYVPAVIAAEVSAGADTFAANCSACHSVAKPPKNKLGPSLLGVVGRKSGSVADYQYSSALKSSNLVWTRKNLDIWLTSPATMVPHDKMSFKGLSDATERANLIEFLATKNN